MTREIFLNRTTADGNGGARVAGRKAEATWANAG